jgi:hypothetical protein
MPQEQAPSHPGRHTAGGSGRRKPILWAAGLFLTAGTVFTLVLLASALH